MSDLKTSEKKFEDHIEKHLLSSGYNSLPYSEYDRTLCLLRSDLVGFIQDTQPETWKQLKDYYEYDVENKVLKRIHDLISKKGLIYVLHNGIDDRGEHVDLYYTQPKSSMNEDHKRLCDLNRFTVVRQLHYSNDNKNSLDMVLFLNGLPIVTMELKNQLSGQNISHSVKQYRNDRDPREPLFKFKRCLVHFGIDNNEVRMTTRLSGPKTFFLPYNKELTNPSVPDGYRTDYMWKEILTKDSLLDIIENFVLVTEESEDFYNEQTKKVESKKKELLIFPRYHQLDLIRKLRQQIKIDGTGENYLVQHTTGSGKSYSIGWLSHTLTSLYQSDENQKRLFDTIIVVTDRRVLDDQLRNTIRSLQKTDGVVNGVQQGSQELKKFLEDGKDIVITTIQKFPFISQTISSLSDRTFGVIIDEVHSSQSGELSKELKKSLSKSDDQSESDPDIYDYEEMIRRELQSRGKHKHISFFGFTGTPKNKTLEVFGEKTSDGQFIPFHSYSMYQSINEGFTLNVLQNYTTIDRFFKVRLKNGKEIELDESEGKKKLVRFVDTHDLTVRNKVQIILDHWINKGSKEIQGRSRGMIVTQSRQLCVQYFQEVNRQLKERGMDYRSLVGFSGEVNYKGEKYTEESLNKELGYEGNIPKGFKLPKYRLLIVSNKFQTGFDEPLVQTMYVDKKLDDVQCVQTLSRLNRTTSGKDKTFVLDFVNKVEDVQQSFQRFYESTILGGETDPNTLYDLLTEIKDYHLFTPVDVNRFCEIFLDQNRDEGSLHPILDSVVDKFVEIDDVQKQDEFRSFIKTFTRMYGYLGQIVTFTDIGLEKHFIFLKYLEKKLPSKGKDRVDISDSVELDSLRIQINHQRSIELENTPTTIDPINPNPQPPIEIPKDLLSEIIQKVNERFGSVLTEDDKVDIERIRERLKSDPEISVYMNGDSSDENKQSYLMKQFDDKLLEMVNDRIEFYKKMEENKSVKNFIFQQMFDEMRQST